MTKTCVGRLAHAMVALNMMWKEMKGDRDEEDEKQRLRCSQQIVIALKDMFAVKAIRKELMLHLQSVQGRYLCSSTHKDDDTLVTLGAFSDGTIRTM